MLKGLPFSAALLFILIAHEMGHFLTSKYYRIDASLPYFIPAPTLIGTFGAFIKMRSPVMNKRVLLDVGANGPLAGLLVTIQEDERRRIALDLHDGLGQTLSLIKLSLENTRKLLATGWVERRA